MTSENFIERTSCPICNQIKFESLYSIDYNSDEMIAYLKSFYGKQGGIKDYTVFKFVSFELNHCNECKLIFQKFIPNNNLMYKLYEEFINPEIKKQEIITGERYSLMYFQKLSREIEFLTALFTKNTNKIKFLDYGMGWGLLCKMAKAYSCETYGTELSASRVEYAKYNGINILTDDVIDKMKFDIINLSDVLEHVSAPFQLIEKLVESLNEGGVLRISVPNGNNVTKSLFMHLLSPELNSIAPLEHINCFSSYTLRYLAEKLNLQLIGSMDYIYNSNSIENKIASVKFFLKKNILYRHYNKNSTNLVFKKK